MGLLKVAQTELQCWDLNVKCQLVLIQTPTYVGKCHICLFSTITDTPNDDSKSRDGLPFLIQLFKLFILGLCMHTHTHKYMLFNSDERTGYPFGK